MTTSPLEKKDSFQLSTQLTFSLVTIAAAKTNYITVRLISRAELLRIDGCTQIDECVPAFFAAATKQKSWKPLKTFGNLFQA
jgi:hypothetical protein